MKWKGKRGGGLSLSEGMLRTLPSTNWSQISAEIPLSLVIMSQRVWNGGEGGMEEKSGGSQMSITPLMIWWPLGKSTKSHTSLSWRNLISSFMAVIQGSWSSFVILRTSLKCLGSESSIFTAMDRWCLIHCWLYIAPISSSLFVGVGAGCSTMIDSSWIGTSPHSRLHSMWMGILSPYVLFGNTFDMGIWAD